MVEVVFDKDDILPFCWRGGERQAWYYMCNKLVLFYPNANHDQDSGVWHTLSNFRAGSDYILKCLDRAMITVQSFFSFSEDRVRPVIPLLDVTLFEHYPIIVSFLGKQLSQRWPSLSSSSTRQC